MSLPVITADTQVTYPDGDVVSTGTVVRVEPVSEGRVAIVLDRTAFHPIDPVWPDQPADQGTLVVGGVAYPVVDAVVGATELAGDDSTLFVGNAPVRTGTEGWAFVVCHLVDDPIGALAAEIVPGTSVEVSVDADLRHALSAGHTACHLASLALNASLADLWTKEVQTDGRGEPDFDRLAIVESRILPHGSLDTYRVGKSLRKKGFAAAEFADRLGAVEAAANAVLAEWVDSGATVSIVRDGTGLGERRTWRCELPQGAVEIACGGTHLTSLAELASVVVALEPAEVPGALELRMRTAASPAAPAS